MLPVPVWHLMVTQQGKRAIALLILAGASVWITTPVAWAKNTTTESRVLSVVQNGALIAYNPVAHTRVLKKKITITAYSSSPDETDDTPDITAAGTKTRKGVAAANFVPFGSKVKIPDLFGNNIFTVEDRMASRFSDRLDIWFPSKEEAKRFGLRVAEVEIEI